MPVDMKKNTPAEKDVLISVRGLEKHFGDLKVLRGVDQ